MSPAQAAAFVQAQAMLCLVELEAMKARDRCTPEHPHTPQDYLDLYGHYEFVLGHNAVINLYQEAARYG
jgi:hypothetical protein